jgi:hypothetical protein
LIELGDNSIYFRVIDIAGNVSSYKTLEVEYKLPPPPAPVEEVDEDEETDEEIDEENNEEEVTPEEVEDYLEDAEEIEDIEIKTKVKDVEKSIDKKDKGENNEPDIRVVEGEEVSISVPKSLLKESENISKVLAYLDGIVYPLGDSIDEFFGSFKAPNANGNYILKLITISKDGLIAAADISVTVDPYGYVYFLDKKGREVRVDTEVYLYEIIDGKQELWKNQENPYKTGSTGEFYFYVPPGSYVLEVKEDGFKDYRSEKFDIEGELININIKLEQDSLFSNFSWVTYLLIFIAIVLLFLISLAIIKSKKNI